MEEKCSYCKGNLYGKKEGKSYGLYCKTCGKWIYKSKELFAIALRVQGGSLLKFRTIQASHSSSTFLQP